MTLCLGHPPFRRVEIVKPLTTGKNVRFFSNSLQLNVRNVIRYFIKLITKNNAVEAHPLKSTPPSAQSPSDV